MKRSTHPKRFNTVAEAMRAKGLTDQQLADIVQCDRSWITRLRQGHPIRSLRTPLRVAEVLEVPVAVLYRSDVA